MGMHLEAILAQTWRLRGCKCGDPLGGENRARLEEMFEAVDGRHAVCSDSVHQLVNSLLSQGNERTLPFILPWTAWQVVVNR